MATLLGSDTGDTLSALSLPVSTQVLLLVDGTSTPPPGTWTSEIVHRTRTRTVSVWRTSIVAQVTLGITILGASSIAAFGVASTDGGAVQINADGTRSAVLGNVSRSIS